MSTLCTTEWEYLCVARRVRRSALQHMCSTLPQPHTHVTQKAPAARATRRLVSTTNAGSSRAHWFFVSAVHNTGWHCQYGAHDPHSDSAHVCGTLCGGTCAGESKQAVSVSLFQAAAKQTAGPAYTTLGAMHKYNICHAVSSWSIWRH